MTRIGDQCKGCSFAYWESKEKEKAATPKASSLADEQSSPEAGSAAPGSDTIEPSIFDDPARALQDAVNRLTEIETKLNATSLRSAQERIEAGAPAANEQLPASQVNCDVLLKEQRMLRTRFNAIFRCIGLSESHEKVGNVAEVGAWDFNEFVEKALRTSCYFRSLPYYQLLLDVKYQLPGITDLLRFMDVIYSAEVSSLITTYDIPGTADERLVRHQFRMDSLTQLLSHWDVLHDFALIDGANRSVLLVDGLDSIALEILGHALKIHPLVFARHLWRNFGRHVTDPAWKGPPLSQAPLCSLPDRPSQRIALDVETYAPHVSLIGTGLRGSETLRSIDTIAELHNLQVVHNLQVRMLNGNTARAKERELEYILSQLLQSCGLPRFPEVSLEESTRLERPIATLIDIDDGMGVASTLELCASATICTLEQRSQEGSSTTLVLRTPSRWHMIGDATLTHDPFRQQVSLHDKNVEASGSVCEALRIVRDLGAAARTNVSQEEISELVSLSLLRAAMSNLWNMAVSDHNMLVNPGAIFILNIAGYDENVVKVSDGCNEHLSRRCQHSRDAIRLTLSVASQLEAEIAGKPSNALKSRMEQGLNLIQKTAAKIDLQLQQTEKQLTVRIDQSFRDLQIKLAETQLEESRKAIKQADTIARLTILAFIFIPVGAVCGFFGMNIVEVAAGGGFPWWVFGITMGVVLAMTLFLAFADSIYALWCFYAERFDGKVFWNSYSSHWPRWLLPRWHRRLLSQRVPYVFRWISLKVKAKVVVGRELRQYAKENTKTEIERRTEV